ncbi:MAG: glutarate dioxygenase GlaH [Planctomycetota bacterium]
MLTEKTQKTQKHDGDNRSAEHLPARTRHPFHPRIVRIALPPASIRAFLEHCKEDSVQSLTYVPYSRLVLAQRLSAILGEAFVTMLRDILHDRETGGFTIGVENQSQEIEEFVKFSTAIAHLIGVPNFDAMGGNYFARFAVQNTDQSDSYLRQAYRNMTLHTDGTYVDEVTDWVLMQKMEERNAVGGRSRLLHLADWRELATFSGHPLANHEFLYKAPASKNVDRIVRQRTFGAWNGGVAICFIDQFAYPETREQACYLDAMSRSLENSDGVQMIELFPGEILVINNRFWLHGRESFQRHPNLYRELLRMRGPLLNT